MVVLLQRSESASLEWLDWWSHGATTPAGRPTLPAVLRMPSPSPAAIITALHFAKTERLRRGATMETARLPFLQTPCVLFRSRLVPRITWLSGKTVHLSHGAVTMLAKQTFQPRQRMCLRLLREIPTASHSWVPARS